MRFYIQIRKDFPRIFFGLWLMLHVGHLFAQDSKTVYGVVTDNSGRPIEDVTVSVKGTERRASTDVDGKFSISNVNPVSLLVFSHVSYESSEVRASGSNPFRIVLEPSLRAMDEVVVIGYGEQRREDLTGSIATADVESMQKAPVRSITDALAGRMAGVQVSSNDGQPGSAPNILIRGGTSLTQSNAPLYVIDGFPVEDPAIAALNPNDIESINVLKDASATAIYGTRGANGVIVIETKQGKIGKPVVELNSSVGLHAIPKQMEMMTPYEFVAYEYERNPTTATQRYFQDGRTLDSYRDSVGINWQDQIFRQSITNIHSIALRGGTPQTRYSISTSMFDQPGVILSSGAKRYQGRISLNQTISSKLRTGVSINYSSLYTIGQTVATGSGSGAAFSTNLMYRTWGYRPVSGRGGLFDDVDDDINTISEVRFNPLVSAENDYTRSTRTDLMANAFVAYSIAQGLEFKTTFSGNNRRNMNEVFFNSLTPQGSPLNIANVRGIHGNIGSSNVIVLSNENTLTYKKRYKQHHNITLLGGFSMRGFSNQTYGFNTQMIPNEQLGISGLDEGVPYATSSVKTNNMLVSFFGRAHYNYKSKYLLTGTLRGDGSSKFAPGNRWGIFPSGAFAWTMSREDFMKDISWLSNAKLRLSYGVTGGQGVSDFAYHSEIRLPLASYYSFYNGTPSVAAVPNRIGNKDLTWESTASANIGYDLSLFNNRVELTVDLYRKTTRDLLLNAQMPSTTGFLSAFKNIGTLENKGLEINLKTTNIQSQSSFVWESDFNLSFNKNKIIALTADQDMFFSNAGFHGLYNTRPLYVAEVGQPAGMFFGFVFDGIYQYEDFESPAPGVYLLKNHLPSYEGNIQPGDIKYRDLNGDGTINDFDMTVIGRGQPIHTGGFNNTFQYKGFDLNVFFQWSYGNNVYNANRLIFEGSGTGILGLNQFASYNDRWTPDNPSNTLYRTNGRGPAGLHSSRVIEDGSYIRLKTLSLGYSIPPNVIRRYHLSALRVNVSAQNLLTWNSYSGMDPEVSVRNTALTPGFDFSAYPMARTIVFGLNASF